MSKTNAFLYRSQTTSVFVCFIQVCVIGLLLISSKVSAQPCTTASLTNPTEASLLNCVLSMNTLVKKIERHPVGKGENSNGTVPLLLIANANLQVYSVSSESNGLGNVIVGVSVDDSSSVGHRYYQASNSFFSGEKQTIIGNGHSICGGDSNIIIAQKASSICGGKENKIYSNNSVISGGSNNQIGTRVEEPDGSVIKSVITGGEKNKIFADFSVISGGKFNEIKDSNVYGTISGGFINTIGGLLSTIGGFARYAAICGGARGQVQPVVSSNTSDSFSVISGGRANIIGSVGVEGTIAGGENNKVDALSSCITGGSNNITAASSGNAGGDFSSVSGGQNNVALGLSSSISGGGGLEPVQFGSGSARGDGNLAQGSYSSISGGFQNTVDIGTNSNSICGGRTNFIGQNSEGNFSTHFGGAGNLILGDYAVVMGGRSHRCDRTSSYSSIGGGQNHVTKERYSSIYGGASGETTGLNSVVVGGQNNLAGGSYATATGGGGAKAQGGDFVGNRAIADHSVTSGGSHNQVRLDGQSGVTSGGRLNQVVARSGVVSGGGSTSGVPRPLPSTPVISGTLGNKASGNYTVVCGGISNVAKGAYSVSSGGVDNTSSSYGSVVAGGRKNQTSKTYMSITGACSQSPSNSSPICAVIP